MNNEELFWDSSSSDSDSCPPEHFKKNIKQTVSTQDPVKIQEILDFSDSDSENYKEIGVMDLTYEEFLAKKQGFSDEKQQKSEKCEKEAPNQEIYKMDSRV